MPVEPLEGERVPTDGFDRVELLLRVLALDETDLARMPLTPGARAIASQCGVRIDPTMPVRPVESPSCAHRGATAQPEVCSEGLLSWGAPSYAFDDGARSTQSIQSGDGTGRDTAFLPIMAGAQRRTTTATSLHALETGQGPRRDEGRQRPRDERVARARRVDAPRALGSQLDRAVRADGARAPPPRRQSTLLGARDVRATEAGETPRPRLPR